MRKTPRARRVAAGTTMQLFKYPFWDHASREVLDYEVHLRGFLLRILRKVFQARVLDVNESRCVFITDKIIYYTLKTHVIMS